MQGSTVHGRLSAAGAAGRRHGDKYGLRPCPAGV